MKNPRLPNLLLISTRRTNWCTSKGYPHFVCSSQNLVEIYRYNTCETVKLVMMNVPAIVGP